jgi:prepilin-type N-terminal cleavage/methylation domain-containing protein
MKKNGLTIIELIISIFILSIAVIAVYSAFSVMIILTSDLTDRLTATYLTQEGMEIVRNIRDANWLYIDAECPDSCEQGWASQGLSACVGGCEADYTTGTADGGSMVQLGGSEALNYLYLTDGFYDYDNLHGEKTKFKRKITITDLSGSSIDSDDYAMKVKVETSWDSKGSILSGSVLAGTCGANNCISAEETLYNWYSNE